MLSDKYRTIILYISDFNTLLFDVCCILLEIETRILLRLFQVFDDVDYSAKCDL
jgi:hypothetical protein